MLALGATHRLRAAGSAVFFASTMSRLVDRVCKPERRSSTPDARCTTIDTRRSTTSEPASPPKPARGLSDTPAQPKPKRRSNVIDAIATPLRRCSQPLAEGSGVGSGVAESSVHKFLPDCQRPSRCPCQRHSPSESSTAAASGGGSGSGEGGSGDALTTAPIDCGRGESVQCVSPPQRAQRAWLSAVLAQSDGSSRLETSPMADAGAHAGAHAGAVLVNTATRPAALALPADEDE